MAGQGAKGGGQVAMPIAGTGAQPALQLGVMQRTGESDQDYNLRSGLTTMPSTMTSPHPTVTMGGSMPAAGNQAVMGAMQQPVQPPTPALAPTAGFNVNQAAAGALQQAMGTAQSGLGFTPRQITAQSYTPTQQTVAGQQTRFDYTPSQATAQQLATTDISQYQSPYQQEVIDMTMRDIASAQEKALNVQGAQAQRAGAFGGSRQGVAEAETRAAYGQQAADAAARLRQQGFQQAMGAAQFDVGQRAGTEAANVAARQAAERFGVGSAQAAEAANVARGQQVQASNVAAQNAAAQYAAQQAASAQAQNLAAQQAAMGTRLGAAGQLAGLGQQAFQTGQTIQGQQMQQGLLQQGLQQALIDAAQAQYAGYTGAPQAALAAPLAALGQTPDQSTTTETFTPGLYNYFQTAAGMGRR